MSTPSRQYFGRSADSYHNHSDFTPERHFNGCAQSLICSLTPRDFREAQEKELTQLMSKYFDHHLPGSGRGSHSLDIPPLNYGRHSQPDGMHYRKGHGPGRYDEPSGGQEMNPKGVDRRTWHGVKHADGSVALGFKGCQVDTDGSGAYRHTEDRTRQNHTSLKLSDGKSLDTDKDSFFVLPPSVAKAYGIKKGDLGWLVQKDTGKAVPVVFGDVGPEGKLGEASVKALKDLGYTNVNGARGVSGDRFEVVFVPGSGNGKGDIARNPAAMAQRLAQLGVPGRDDPRRPIPGRDFEYA